MNPLNYLIGATRKMGENTEAAEKQAPLQAPLQAAPPRARTARLFELLTGPGAFRMSLALLVFVSHVSRLNVGIPAVVLFFMLSGYWVSQIFDRQRIRYHDYLIDRWLRIWPLTAFAMLLFSALLALLHLTGHGSMLSSLLILGIATWHGDMLGILWSLDIELQFYIILPLLLLLTRMGPMTTLAMWIASLALGVLLRDHHIATVLFYVPAFGGGVWLYASQYRPTARIALASVAVFAVIAALLTLFPETRGVMIKGADWQRESLTTLAWTMTLLPFVGWNVHRPSGPFDRALGNLSFPFYLMHFQLLAIGLTLGLYPQGMAGKLLALAVSLLVSIIVFRFVDRPIERWRVARRQRLPRIGA